MFNDALVSAAAELIANARQAGLRIATAESCTGGLVGGLLTEIPGSSAVFERGFITYSNHAKVEVLGVEKDTLRSHGAVSEAVARAMAEGALARARVHLTVALTGVAGPGGGTPDKPVGLVHLASAGKGRPTLHRALRLGAIGRSAVREESVAEAIRLLSEQVAAPVTA